MKFPAWANTTPLLGTWNENSIPVSVMAPVARLVWTDAGPIDESVCHWLEIVCVRIPWVSWPPSLKVVTFDRAQESRGQAGEPDPSCLDSVAA